MYSHSLLKRFVKDYNLPIQLVREPYFSYYIDLYDKVYQSKTLFKQLENTINQLGSEKNFFETCQQVIDTAIQTVKNTPEFQAFNNDRLDKYNVGEIIGTKGTIYLPEYDKGCFLSLDLKKANYHALKFYNLNIVLNTNTYEEFIRKFTDIDYICQSKYIRQVIFGHLNPKKQTKIQKYIIHNLSRLVMNYFDMERIRSTSFDEIVIQLSSPDEYENNDEFKNTIQNFVKDFGVELNTEVFYLKQLKPHSFFVKEYLKSNKIEFKAISTLFMPQAYKHYFNLPICDYDLMFYHEGYVAKYIDPIFFENQKSDQ